MAYQVWRLIGGTWIMVDFCKTLSYARIVARDTKHPFKIVEVTVL